MISVAAPTEETHPIVRHPLGLGHIAGKPVAKAVDPLPDDPVRIGPARDLEDPAGLSLGHQHVAVRQRLLLAAGVGIDGARSEPA